MDDNDAKAEIKRLTDKLNECNVRYFGSEGSLLSDYEYDCLLDELVKLEEKYPQYKLDNSPTEVLGDINIKGFNKITHKVPMLSLKKTYSFDDLNAFLDNVEKNNDNITYVCELKLDGISIDANYIDGTLKTISTRGDGNQGDDITTNKIYIKNLPLHIDCKSKNIHLRGEVIMKFEDFNNANKSIKDKNTRELLSNPRNTVSGTLKTLKKKDSDERSLTVFFYNIICEDNQYTDIKTQVDVLNTLDRFNAPICKLFKYCKTRNDIFDYINYYEKEKDNLDFPIDGIVIKINELEYSNKLGNTSKNPRGAIAFKYKPNATPSKLINVEFNVGRTGIITPVANFEPINLNGTIVKRATLHNENEINRLGLREGDTVLVKKSGEIIPKIIGIDITKRNINNKKIEFIKECQFCKSTIIKKNDLYYCPNKECKGRIIESITHFVSKKALDIKSIGRKVINFLVDIKLLNNITDIYKLKYRDLVRLPRFDVLSAQKTIEEINNSKKQPFYKLIYGLGIEGVGEVVAKNISETFKNIENLENCKIENLVEIPLVGQEVAKNITEYFQNEENIKLIDDLKIFGLNMNTENDKAKIVLT